MNFVVEADIAENRDFTVLITRFHGTTNNQIDAVADASSCVRFVSYLRVFAYIYARSN